MIGKRSFVFFAAIALLGACGKSQGPATPVAVGEKLTGLFSITAGNCSGATNQGSFFRMVEPKGTPAKGPFVKNTDSSCTDKSYTPLSPGSEGGLITGSYQPQPSPPFDASGNGAAKALTQPQKWFSVAFSLATNATDPQTKEKVAAPVLMNKGGKLSGDLRAFAAAWNGQHFNQGAPKPNGTTPGNTKVPTGTYNVSTDAYTLEWASQIVGGPFNNFTGIWHLEGKFQAKS